MKVVYNHFYISFKKQEHLKHTKTLQFMRANFLNCEKGIRFGLQARHQIKLCLFFLSFEPIVAYKDVAYTKRACILSSLFFLPFHSNATFLYILENVGKPKVF